MSKSPRRPRPRIATRVGVAGFATLCLLPAAAVAQAPTPLPGIVVEGATLAPPAPRRSAPAPQPTAAAPSAAPGQPAGTPGDGVGPPAPDAAPDAAPYATAGEPVGSAVTVITGEEMRRQQVRQVADALRSVPGLAVSRTGSFGALTQVRIRGAEANHTLVIIDGVVANDTTTGAFDLSDLSPETIERIEVIRGPQSGLYGSNALGGVINIVTRQGRGPAQMSVRTEAGSFGTFDYVLSGSAGTERAWGAITYHERQTRGFDVAPFGSEPDGASLKSFSVKGGVRIADGLVLDFALRHSDKRGERDTEGGAVGTLAVQVDDPSHFANVVLLGAANLRWDSRDGRFTHVLRLAHNDTRTTDISPSFASKNISNALRYGYLGTWRFDTPAIAATQHALTVLVEREEESFTPLSDFADGLERNRQRLATALEYKADVLRRLAFTANIRRNDNDIYRDFTTWRTAVSLKVPELGLRPHASLGTGVKLPTMLETFGLLPGFFTPNPNLLPEESRGWDAGIEATLWQGRAVLDVTYFKQDLRNRIDGLAPGPAFTFTAINVPGISQREGLEVAARWLIAPTLTLSGAYTWLMARDATGLDEVRRPRDTARADLTWRFADSRGTATLSAVYNGAMDDNAFRIVAAFPGFVSTTAERTTLADYWLVNAAASYKLAPGIEAFARVENLLNERYYEVYGFATPGIAGFAGVKLTLGGDGAALAGR